MVAMMAVMLMAWTNVNRVLVAQKQWASNQPDLETVWFFRYSSMTLLADDCREVRPLPQLLRSSAIKLMAETREGESA